MKVLNYAIEDLQIGKASLVDGLGFIETEYCYFRKDDSFYRRYNLELGLDICILELDLKTDIELLQLAAKQTIYFTNIFETNKGLKLISNKKANLPIKINITSKDKIRSLWFSYSERWLENKSISEYNNNEFFTNQIEKLEIPQNEEFDNLFNDIFALANKHPINNFLLKVKFYSILEKIMK